MRNATHTMRNGELSILLYSVACRLLIFCEKTPQKPMRKQNASSIPGQQSAKTRVSAHASKEIAHHPARRQTHALPTTTIIEHRRVAWSWTRDAPSCLHNTTFTNRVTHQTFSLPHQLLLATLTNTYATILFMINVNVTPVGSPMTKRFATRSWMLY